MARTGSREQDLCIAPKQPLDFQPRARNRSHQAISCIPEVGEIVDGAVGDDVVKRYEEGCEVARYPFAHVCVQNTSVHSAKHGNSRQTAG